MSVGVLLITHSHIGTNLLDAARSILGDLPLPAEAFPVSPQTDSDDTLRRIKAIRAGLDQGEGVLILTDLYAATPDNLARSCGNGADIRIVSGVSLPMVIKIMNYSRLQLPELAEKAIIGASNGIKGS